MISRRSLLVAAPLVLYSSRGRAWFPHGTPASASGLTITITHNDAANPTGWMTIANGGNFSNQAQIDAYNAVIAQVVSDLESWFTTPNGLPATVNIEVDYIPVAGAVTSSGTHYTPNTKMTYASFLSIYNSLPNKSSLQTSAWATFPVSDPSPGGGNSWNFPTGLYAILTNGNDINYLGEPYQTTFINSLLGPTGFDTTPNGSTCATGKYGLYTNLLHEFTFTMGREMGDYSVAQLLSYKSGSLDMTQSDASRYPSINSGVSSFNGGHFSAESGVAEGCSWSDIGNSSFDLNTSTGWGSVTPFPMTSAGGSGSGQYIRPLDLQWMHLMGVGLTPLGKSIAGI